MNIKKEVRNIVYSKMGDRCYYCGCDCNENKTLDHKKPKSLGGTNDTNNLVVCCWICNQLKADFTIDQFNQIFLRTNFSFVNDEQLSYWIDFLGKHDINSKHNSFLVSVESCLRDRRKKFDWML